jgi:YD repeat-containing protein
MLGEPATVAMRARVQPWIGIGRGLTALCAAAASIALFSGGSCFVAFSSSTCDPCDVNCKSFEHPCNDGLSQVAAHTLPTHRWTLARDVAESEIETFDLIFGLSLERAYGPAAFGPEELARFSRNVIAVNHVRLRVRAEQMVLDGVELFEGGWLVSFHAADARQQTSLTFSYDCAGRLLAIERRDNRP